MLEETPSVSRSCCVFLTCLNLEVSLLRSLRVLLWISSNFLFTPSHLTLVIYPHSFFPPGQSSHIHDVSITIESSVVSSAHTTRNLETVVRYLHCCNNPLLQINPPRHQECRFWPSCAYTIVTLCWLVCQHGPSKPCSSSRTQQPS